MKAALKQLLDDRLIELAARAISGAVTRTGVISSGNMAYVKRLGQLGTAVPEKSRRHRQDRKEDGLDNVTEVSASSSASQPQLLSNDSGLVSEDADVSSENETQRSVKPLLPYLQGA